jgi:hypothetical protein
MKPELALVCLLLCASTHALTTTQYNAATSALVQLLGTDPTNFIPLAVRLTFHDCVGGCDGCVNLNDSNNNGLAPIVNALEGAYAQFNTAMSRADFWALAGIVALQVASTGPGQPLSSSPVPLTFTWGRQDCPTSPTTTALDDFPNAMGNLSEVGRVFVTGEFAMTWQQVTALLGAHSLGGTHPDVSGFHGPWAPPITRFTNKFFVNIASRTYSHSLDPTVELARRAQPPPPTKPPKPAGGAPSSPPPKAPPPPQTSPPAPPSTTRPPPPQTTPPAPPSSTTRPPPPSTTTATSPSTTSSPATFHLQQFDSVDANAKPIMLLHTDMGLYKSFPVTTSASGKILGVAPSGCVTTVANAAPGSYNSVANCPSSPTAQYVQLYASNLNQFYSDFAQAYTLMIGHSAGPGAQYTLNAVVSG